MHRRPLHPAAALLIACLFPLAGCSRIDFDPGQGAEGVYIRTLERPDDVQLTYLRTREQGPLVLEKDTWTWFWSIPVNRPDLGFWLYRAMPEGAEAANVRAAVWTPWYGYLLMIPTLGIVRVDTVRFQADPVRWETRPAPAPPPP
jgi:hypothetical protein